MTDRVDQPLPGQKSFKDAISGHPDPSGPPQASHEETAEETRRQQQARPERRPDRDDKLVHVGRGQQTHG